MNYWVWVLGEVDALRWVVDQKTMAFPDSASTRIRDMGAGDRAVLYTTRGAFHNPTRDEARLVGVATVDSSPNRPEQPLTIAGREYAWSCSIEVETLLAERQGPTVRALVPELELVRKPAAWGVYFRQSPVRINETDFECMRRAIETYGPSDQ